MTTYEEIKVGVDTYKVAKSIHDVPLGYVIWNIGRENFPVTNHIPMCRMNKVNCSIDPTTLFAVPCQSEEQALKIMKKSIMTGTLSTADLIRDYKLA